MKSKAELLVEYVKSLDNFIIVTEIDGNYQNIGATIIDGILQSGIAYATTVKPRVEKISFKILTH